jgi:hypothetical protein
MAGKTRVGHPVRLQWWICDSAVDGGRALAEPPIRVEPEILESEVAHADGVSKYFNDEDLEDVFY